MSCWFCQCKPFWIPVSDTFQKAYLEEWIDLGDDSSSTLGEQGLRQFLRKIFLRWYSTTKNQRLEEAPSAARSAGEPDAPTWEPIGPQGTPSFWERTEAPLPPPRPRCNLIHPKQLIPFPERLELPFPSEEILLDYEDVVSSSQNHYTTWVKTDPDVTSGRHMVDVQKAVAEFREASARRDDTSCQEYRLDRTSTWKSRCF